MKLEERLEESNVVEEENESSREEKRLMEMAESKLGPVGPTIPSLRQKLSREKNMFAQTQ